MKANELMIGDLILVADGQQMNVRKVSSITRKKIGYHKEDGETRMWHAPLCSVKPIPLTEEILIANGFRKSIEEGVCYFPERYQKVNNLGFAVETDGDGKWFITDHELIGFRHVHKFQHILRDCEMTNLADNFKVSPNKKR